MVMAARVRMVSKFSAKQVEHAIYAYGTEQGPERPREQA
jgi:hypothetical protein